MVVQTTITLNPTNIRVFRPAFSIKAKETKVIATFMPPMPKVADWAPFSVKPAEVKMEVEKKIAALIPKKSIEKKCLLNVR